MSLQSLSIVLITLAVSTSAAALWAEPTYQPPSHGQQVVGATVVVCDQGARPAPMATWWANCALGRFCRAVARDTKRINCWPKPFVKADREAVRMPFVQMVANGWKRQNTLGGHHFEAETGKLNRAGQLKIRQILLEGLPQHRDLYVCRAERPSETTARVDAVQQYAARTVRDGMLPQVFETDIPAPGWPAQQVDLVDRKWAASMPEPRMPEREATQETD